MLSITTAPEAPGDLLSADRTTTRILVPIQGIDRARTPSATPWTPSAESDAIRGIAGSGGDGLQVSVTGPAGIQRDTVQVFANADLRLLAATILLVLVLGIYRVP